MIPTVFGRIRLGYLVIESNKFTEWRRFGADAIGMHVDDTLPDVMRFRLDDYECRFLVVRGPAEDVVALGWQVDDHETFDEIISRVTRHGVPSREGTREQAALRGVERMVSFPGPNNLTQEIHVRARPSAAPLLTPGHGGFVTGEAGIGHVALMTKKPHQVRGYYDTVFDARLSDYIEETISGVRLKVRFLRVNQRHHTVAIANVQQLRVNPIRTRVQHLNIQVAELADLTTSYERVTQLGFEMALTIGQHPNDGELSYYAVTPSGFEWEVGWNPITVDEQMWEPTLYRTMSTWGHTPVGQSTFDLLEKFAVAAKSWRRDEDTVPALSGSGIPDSLGRGPSRLVSK